MTLMDRCPPPPFCTLGDPEGHRAFGDCVVAKDPAFHVVTFLFWQHPRVNRNSIRNVWTAPFY